jgi:Ni/Co efflux regulator RcnB
MPGGRANSVARPATLLCTKNPAVYTRYTWKPHDGGSFNARSYSIKSNVIVCAIAVASLGFSALSFADGNDRYGPRKDQYRGHQRYDRRDEDHARRWDDRRAYRLSPPPRGHEWVQVGPDFVLIAIATGLIAHIVLSQ